MQILGLQDRGSAISVEDPQRAGTPPPPDPRALLLV